LELFKGAPGDGIVYIAPFHDLEGSISDNLKIKFNHLKEDIVNRKIVIPERYDPIVDGPNKN
jgi:basic membrane protein A